MCSHQNVWNEVWSFQQLTLTPYSYIIHLCRDYIRHTAKKPSRQSCSCGSLKSQLNPEKTVECHSGCRKWDPFVFMMADTPAIGCPSRWSMGSLCVLVTHWSSPMDCLSKPELLRNGFLSCAPGQGPIREGAVKGIHKGIFSFCIYSQDVIPGNESKEYQRPSTDPVDPDMILHLLSREYPVWSAVKQADRKECFQILHLDAAFSFREGASSWKSQTRHMHNLQGLDYGYAHSHNNVFVTWKGERMPSRMLMPLWCLFLPVQYGFSALSESGGELNQKPQLKDWSCPLVRVHATVYWCLCHLWSLLSNVKLAGLSR